MGANTAGTLNRIAETRERLEQDLEVLSARLPDRQDATTAAAISAGGIAAALGTLWFSWSRYRDAKQHRELAALLHDAGVEARGARPGTGGGVWKVLLGTATAGAIGAIAYAATRRTIIDDTRTWTER